MKGPDNLNCTMIGEYRSTFLWPPDTQLRQSKAKVNVVKGILWKNGNHTGCEILDSILLNQFMAI